MAGRPVPQGWYSEPWWKPALVGGTWGLGSVLLFSSLFSGMGGIASTQAWEHGHDAGQEDAMSGADSGDNDFGAAETSGAAGTSAEVSRTQAVAGSVGTSKAFAPHAPR